ncbi:MAG: hypothetical protein QF570_09940 [Myxococcota bacterium]|jgi:hypothetical protein|nr:hypothetical protein [Myxococcota bacterium]
MLEVTGPNAEQISYWNEVTGPRWVRLTDTIDRRIDAAFRDVSIDGFETTIDVAAAGSLDDAVQFMSEMGPAGAMLRDASPEVAEAARGSIRDVLAKHDQGGRIDLAATVWFVSARA